METHCTHNTYVEVMSDPENVTEMAVKALCYRHIYSQIIYYSPGGPRNYAGYVIHLIGNYSSTGFEFTKL